MNSSTLHGRAKELQWLRSLWDVVTKRDPSGGFIGGPRMAVVVAETGYGKTRLVQALYQQLTQDPAWDAAEINYWPNAFQAAGEQLRVNPDPAGHVPMGPPQFLWLGMRWQPTEVRNLEERACAIPAARDALHAHVAIADRYRPAWQHARAELERNIRRGSVVDSIARAADLAVPFGELGIRMLKGATALARERSSARRDVEAERQRQANDASQQFLAEMREVFGGVGSAGRVLPTVLWLDDAQWIDSTTLRFVHALWQEARERQWPLLLVATHWEREWEELLSAPADQGLAALAGEPGVEILRLGGSTRDDLGKYLRERLPGLTSVQRDLLLDKAGGNFLTMVENVGELIAHDEAFVGGSAQAALTDEGEHFVREWESERQRRVEQRFSRLASEVRTVLGWGSVLGIRFLKDVIADHALRTGLTKEPGLLIDACVTPFAILGTPSPNVREFRDRAFHLVAKKHFQRWSGSHGASLRTTLRDHLVRWVNASFDDDGAVLRPEEDDPAWKSPEGAAIFLAPEERRDLLGMAVAELELPGQPDWTDPAHAAALRARMLLTWTDEFERLFDRVRRTAQTMVGVDWTRVPERVIAHGDRFLCARDWQEAGALQAARPLLEQLLAETRREHRERRDDDAEWRLCAVMTALCEVESELGAKERALRLAREIVAIEERLVTNSGEPDAQRDLAIALLEVADLEMELDDLVASRLSCERSLEIRERLLGEEPSIAELRDLSVALDHLGHLDALMGDDEAAARSYGRSLGIARRVAKNDGSLQARRDLSISLMNMAEALDRTEGSAAALELLLEALGLTREVAAEEDHPDLQDDLAQVLELVGDAEAALDRLDEAHRHLEESLSVRRAIYEAAPTPQRRRGISTVLSSLVEVAIARDEPEDALALALEVVAIDCEAIEVLRTSKAIRDLGCALMSVARIEYRLGHDESLGHALEALELRKESMRSLDRPRHRLDVWDSYELIACITTERHDDSILVPAEEWLAHHLALGEEAKSLNTETLAATTAYAAMIESTTGNVVGAVRRAEAALELLGPRDDAEDGQSTLTYAAHLVANAVIVACAHELDGTWAKAELRTALAMANEWTERAIKAADLEPDWWDAMACWLTYEAAESYFGEHGDAASAARATARASQWKGILDGL